MNARRFIRPTRPVAVEQRPVRAIAPALPRGRRRSGYCLEVLAASLAENARYFERPADVELAIPPVFERELTAHRGIQKLSRCLKEAVYTATLPDSSRPSAPPGPCRHLDDATA